MELCSYFGYSYSDVVSKFLSKNLSFKIYKPIIIDFRGPGEDSSPGK
jgi:hypothetical protein